MSNARNKSDISNNFPLVNETPLSKDAGIEIKLLITIPITNAIKTLLIADVVYAERKKEASPTTSGRIAPL
jgi:hypothetical protein